MQLEIAAEGCCKGHKCDNCATCRKGRCCRRDNPDYKLPALGEWDGPIYGDLGVLKDDGERVECHCCGEWFHNVAVHAYLAHNLMASEYKSIFGFARGKALIDPTTQEKLRAQNHSHLLRGGIEKMITPEQRSAIAGWDKRLEVKRILGERISGENHDRIRRQGVKQSGDATSKYVGVTQQGTGWRAQIVYRYQNISLGVYDTEEDAARAYDIKAREIYGDKAGLNFPEAVVIQPDRRVRPSPKPAPSQSRLKVQVQHTPVRRLRKVKAAPLEADMAHLEYLRSQVALLRTVRTNGTPNEV